ncbi:MULTISPECIES: AI-2E family transporter [unclassified Romboutsia]|uniref:AI-2E family transporter n=1 Tax=unclassified Romboutsia TaxID=2626894 RepID=UPI0008231C4B|nr:MULTISPECIES: AI-2E family transporter [unclassified Romboutsia]SCH69215.1 pheromone autoinducer 2 transporter [uncultured Clostridium sp.]
MIKLKNQFLLATYIMIFLLFIIKPALVPSIISRIIIAFKPFIIGGVIAFLINIPMKIIEEKLVKPLLKSHKKYENLSRTIALALTLILICLVIAAFINYIAPQLIESVTTLTNSIPDYISSVQSFIMEKSDKLNIFNDIKIDIPSMVQKSMSYIGNLMNMFISNLFNFTLGITNLFINFFLGIIIAMYILLTKDTLALQFKKVIYAFFSEKVCEKIMYILKLANRKFSKFILGQSTDGLILGTIFFIVFSFVKIPYALLISIMIPILNFIPIFGTYVGILISAFIILMVKPSAVILFLVLIISIQQLDGKFVYPIVVGNSLGLPSLWILFAIIVGGNLFGVIGMIIGMPLVSVIYELFGDYVNKRIKHKK